MSTNQAQPSLESQIPLEVLNEVKVKAVVESSFATGPGFCAGKVDKHDPAITFDQGLAWMERYRRHLKGACMIFDDESRLYFAWGKFDCYVAKPSTPRPEPGIEMADLTDPEVLALHGLRIEGREIKVDDKRGVVIGQLSDEEFARYQKRLTHKPTV